MVSLSWPRRVAATALVASLLTSHVVIADDRDPAAAEALFRQGRDDAKRGDFAEACPKFEESYRLDPSPGTLLNLADCSEKLGRIATAWAHYEKLIQQVTESDSRAALARSRSQALEPKIPKLALRVVAAAPPSTLVMRDGVVVGTGSHGVPIPVDPGRHVVKVTARGRDERVYNLDLVEGQLLELAVEPGPVTGTAPAPTTSAPPPVRSSRPPSEEHDGSAQTALGLIIGGVGVTSLVVGAVTGLMVFKKKSEFDLHCDDRKACDQQGLDAASSGKTLATVSTITTIIGVAGVGAGVALVLTAPSASQPQTALRARVSPLGAATLSLEGAF